MPKVRGGSTVKSPTHEVTLSDGIEEIGFRVRPSDVQEVSQSPSTIIFGKGGGKFGDWEPGFSHVEQRNWSGGRGQEDFSQDDTQFFDSQSAWTLTENRLCPAPMWYSHYRTNAVNALPGSARPDVGEDVNWVKVTDAAYYARSFAPDATFTASTVQVWLRRIGGPSSTITVALYSNAGTTVPNAALQTFTASTVNVTDWVSVLYPFATTVQVTSGTTYWVVAYATTGTRPDNDANHWEVAYGAGATDTSKTSTDGTTWTTTAKQLYFRVSSSTGGGAQKSRMFMCDGQIFWYNQLRSGTASVLYTNGDRGIATSATTVTVTDSNKAWTTNVFAGAWVRIISGTGTTGEPREIASNTATALTISTAWDITPSTDSEYLIYACDFWQNITPGSGSLIDGVIKDVAVCNDIAYFAMGGSIDILEMRYNAGTTVHTFQFQDDTGNKADFLHVFNDPTDGVQVWRALNGTTMQVSRGSPVTWGSTVTFGTGIPIGDQTYKITGLTDYNDQLWAFKEDSIWAVKSDKAAKLNVGLDSMPESTNGAAYAAQNLFLYFSWSHSIERLYGGTLDDVGPWRGAGLPSGRQGVVSAMVPAISWLFAGIDAGTVGTSSVLCYDGRGWHEIWRAPVVNCRLDDLLWEPCPGTRPRLWIGAGGDMYYIVFPRRTLNPMRDTGLMFSQEAVVESATIDMAITDLPKFFKDVALVSQNLTTGIAVDLDYQVDDDVGTTTWINAGAFALSPRHTVKVNEGRVRQLRYRLRLHTNDADVPPIVKATSVKAFARTPFKRQWNLRVNVSDLKRTRTGGKDIDPDEIYDWLRGICQEAGGVRMRSSWKKMDDIWVVVEPPTLLRKSLNTIQQWWSGTFQITLREA